MRARLEAFKPAAPARVHVLLAAAMWTVVGAALAFAGGRWLLRAGLPHVAPAIALAVLLGALKGRFVLQRTAARTVARIRARGDGRCLGGFLSLRSWALVAVMATAGAILRRGLLPRAPLGFIYLAVGTALLLASAHLWRAWRCFDRPGT